MTRPPQRLLSFLATQYSGTVNESSGEPLRVFEELVLRHATAHDHGSRKLGMEAAAPVEIGEAPFVYRRLGQRSPIFGTSSPLCYTGRDKK
jgi:hypothetical protein